MFNIRKVTVDDLVNFRLKGKAKITRAALWLLIGSVLFPFLAVVALLLSFRLGAERYDKEVYERVKHMRLTACVYLLITALAVFSSIFMMLPLILLAKGWVVVRLVLLVVVYKRMPYSGSDVAFARDAYAYMKRKGEEHLVIENL